MTKKSYSSHLQAERLQPSPKLYLMGGGGTIFGACYSRDFKGAEYACIENEEELYRLKGSKYLKTEKKIYQNGEYISLWEIVSEKLKAGKKVLFIGLGCDVGALKSYITGKNINANNLYTIDLICYGPIPSEVHRQYIIELERKYNSRIINFTSRFKLKGWTPAYILAEFENGKKYCEPLYESDYGMAFSRYAHRACYNCKFRGKNHCSDITIGDFWGLRPGMKGYNPDGVSVIITRTERGEELVKQIDKQKFTLEPADIDFALEHNQMYFKLREIPEDYESFFQDLKHIGLHKTIIKHQGLKLYCKMKVKRFIKKIIPYKLKEFIKSKLYVL